MSFLSYGLAILPLLLWSLGVMLSVPQISPGDYENCGYVVTLSLGFLVYLYLFFGLLSWWRRGRGPEATVVNLAVAMLTSGLLTVLVAVSFMLSWKSALLYFPIYPAGCAVVQALWRAPTAQSQLSELGFQTALEDFIVAGDRRSCAATVSRRRGGTSDSGFIIGIDPNGEIDPSYWATSAALMRPPGDEHIIGEKVWLIGHFKRAGEAFAESVPHWDQLTPQGRTSFALPGLFESHVSTRLFTDVGGVWLGGYKQMIFDAKPERAVAFRLGPDQKLGTVIRMSDLARAVPELGDQISQVDTLDTSPAGRIAFSLHKDLPPRIAVFGIDGAFLRAFRIPGSAKSFTEVSGAVFLDEGHLMVLTNQQRPRQSDAWFLDVDRGSIRLVAGALQIEDRAYRHDLGELDEDTVLVCTKEAGLRVISANAEKQRRIEGQLSRNPCAPQLKNSTPVMTLTDGVVVKLGEESADFIPHGEGPPLLPLLKIRKDGTLDPKYNPRLPELICDKS